MLWIVFFTISQSTSFVVAISQPKLFKSIISMKWKIYLWDRETHRWIICLITEDNVHRLSIFHHYKLTSSVLYKSIDICPDHLLEAYDMDKRGGDQLLKLRVCFRVVDITGQIIRKYFAHLTPVFKKRGKNWIIKINWWISNK